ncbi:4332_t:CDS:2 [Paraglomus occultum]|uniref:4332_t:CDS:1 n=1 Tax=Paraglomus occultum TaxID=144539 RepID=A0A9N9CVA3_9GLOM|nr:4332_t:CDS:2 [Paraglomus occultum]
MSDPNNIFLTVLRLVKGAKSFCNFVVKKVYMNEWQKYLVTGEGKAKPLSSLASSSSADQLGDNGYKWPKTRKPLESISISDDEGDDNGSHTITNFNSGNSSDGDAEKDDADMATDGDKSTDNSARRFEAFVIIDHPGEVPIVTTRPRLQRKNLTRGS